MKRLDLSSGNVTFDGSKPTRVTEVPNTSGTGDLLLNLKTSDLTAWKSRKNAAGKIDPYVTYADLGAVGDGTTDDSNAIVAAHYAANYLNIPVRPAPGGPYKYRLGKPDRIVTIRTDTDFGTNEIIIDDRKIDTVTKQAPNNQWLACQLPVFEVVTPSNMVVTTVLKTPAKKAAASIDLSAKLPAGNWFIVAVDDEPLNRRFMREGDPQKGVKQTDVFLVNQDGIVQKFDPSAATADAPILWDFSADKTFYKAYRADTQGLPPLRVSGGNFTTIANLVANQDSMYMQRNLYINRSNVTVQGLTHLVQYLDATGQPISKPGNCPYLGFLWAFQCSNLNLVNCRFTGLKVQKLKPGVLGGWLKNGSYGICLQAVVGARLTNCTQSNFADVDCWGLMKSDYCKNLIVDNCKITRVDAHLGIYNLTVKASEIGHMGVRVVGWGDLRIDGCTFNWNENKCLVVLRPDYGSFWTGNINITNCTLRFPKDGANSWSIINPCLSYVAQGKSYGYGFPLSINGNIKVSGLAMTDPALGPVPLRPMQGGMLVASAPPPAQIDPAQPSPFPVDMVTRPTPKVQDPLPWPPKADTDAKAAPGIFFDIAQTLDGKPSDFVKNYLAPLANGKVSVT